MKYFFDTEFYERIENGKWCLDLISIGIVSETGEELYLENSDFDLTKVTDPWLQANVIPHLKGKSYAVPLTTIRFLIESFVDERPEFWAYFAAYDWVLFSQIFGRLVDMPRHFPFYCLDLRQTMHENRITKDMLPKLKGNKHNALDDAKWLREAHSRVVQIQEGSCC